MRGKLLTLSHYDKLIVRLCCVFGVEDYIGVIFCNSVNEIAIIV